MCRLYQRIKNDLYNEISSQTKSKSNYADLADFNTEKNEN